VADYAFFDMKERQKFINEKQPFGFRLWKSPVYALAETELTQFGPGSDVCQPPTFRSYPSWQAEVSQVLWLIVFGWWLAILHLTVGTLLWLSVVGRSYATVCLNLALYLIWPFGKHMEEVDSLDANIPLANLIPRAEYDLTPAASRRGSEATLSLPATPKNSKLALGLYYFFLGFVLGMPPPPPPLETAFPLNRISLPSSSPVLLNCWNPGLGLAGLYPGDKNDDLALFAHDQGLTATLIFLRSVSRLKFFSSSLPFPSSTL